MSSIRLVPARCALLAGMSLTLSLNFVTGCATRVDESSVARTQVLSDVRTAHSGVFDLTPLFRVRYQLPAPGFCAFERGSIEAICPPWIFAAHDDELHLRNTSDGRKCIVECVRAQLLSPAQTPAGVARVRADDAASHRIILDFRAQCVDATISINELLFIEQNDACAYLVRRFEITGMAPNFELMVHIPMVDESGAPLEVTVNGSPLVVARETRETMVLLARDEATEIAVAIVPKDVSHQSNGRTMIHSVIRDTNHRAEK